MEKEEKVVTPEFERMVAAALAHQWGDWKGRVDILEAVMIVESVELARRGAVAADKLADLRRRLLEDGKTLADFL